MADPDSAGAGVLFRYYRFFRHSCRIWNCLCSPACQSGKDTQGSDMGLRFRETHPPDAIQCDLLCDAYPQDIRFSVSYKRGCADKEGSSSGLSEETALFSQGQGPLLVLDIHAFHRGSLLDCAQGRKISAGTHTDVSYLLVFDAYSTFIG